MTVEWVCALSAYIIQRASAGLCYAKAEGVTHTVRITNPYAVHCFVLFSRAKKQGASFWEGVVIHHSF